MVYYIKLTGGDTINQRKYWAPAVEKTHLILEQIAKEPGKLKLMDLSNRLGIHKSSMFVLLHTLEQLGWVGKGQNDAYILGHVLGSLGHAFLEQFDLKERFLEEAAKTRDSLQETIQLAKLDGDQVFYLEKVEMPSRVRIVSEPGMRFPAHATALGKALLAWSPEGALERTLHDPLEELTPNTITSLTRLAPQLKAIRMAGYSIEEQESVMGFCCVAAPILASDGSAVAAVSASIAVHKWNETRDKAIGEVQALAKRLSLSLSIH
ncbi:IclR family transcriptional regulator [Cohnella endophytica]|uniref:IclR family transcriptional regulator n=1 Tax=Cohnella endophytica TaxID=2419778 RepID=A0A494XWF8_9BACL|nr:IclR family transcriptional regulator [Cohnella endophytica]RKP54014.1 IclR family transcriptional regulator [Cohnella endophytica]